MPRPTYVVSPSSVQLLQTFADYRRKAGTAESTVEQECTQLRRFIHSIESHIINPFDARSIKQQHVMDHFMREQDHLSEHTRKREFLAVQTFFEWLVRLKVILTNPCAHIGAVTPERKSATYVEKKQVKVTMSPELYAHLQRFTRKGDTVQATILNACREWVDNKADVLGSRRHFTSTFNRRMTDLEAKLDFFLTLIGVSIADLGDTLTLNLLDLNEEQKQEFSFTGNLAAAMKRTAEDGWFIKQQILLAIEDAKLMEERNRDEIDLMRRRHVPGTGDKVEESELRKSGQNALGSKPPIATAPGQAGNRLPPQQSKPPTGPAPIAPRQHPPQHPAGQQNQPRPAQANPTPAPRNANSPQAQRPPAPSDGQQRPAQAPSIPPPRTSSQS